MIKKAIKNLSSTASFRSFLPLLTVLTFKKMKKRVILLFPLVLIACELVVDVDVPFEKSNLTVNAYFNPDSLWSAYVSSNRHILADGPLHMVNDANVIVY